MPNLRPTPILRWLALACVPGADPLPPPPGGWQLLPFLAERHRIGGLLWRRSAPQAADIPSFVAAALKADAQAIAASNLRAAVECRRIADAFAAARLPLLFVKGLTLSKLAYGDATIKMSRDIDLLVLPDDLEPAAAVLAAAGYRPCIPATLGMVPAWHRRSKESVWTAAGGAVIELHSRLVDNPKLLTAVTAASPSRRVEVAPGVVLPTLCEPELLAYLAVHGASSAWFRLKWLADWATLLRDRSQEELNQVHASMTAFGAGRAAGLALMLADELFGLAVSPQSLRRFKADPALRWLAGEALRQLEAAEEPTQRSLGTVGIHLSQLLLGRGLAFPLREASRRAAEVVGRRLLTG